MSRKTVLITKNMIDGAKTIPQAFTLAFSKKDLLALSLLPLLITICVYTFAFAALFDFLGTSIDNQVQSWNSDSSAFVSAILSFFAPLLKIVTVLVLGLLGAVTFSFSSSILALPFNDFLAERTEKHIPISTISVSERGKKAFFRHLWIDLWKTIIAALLSILLFVLSWIPLVHFITIPFLLILVAFPFISFAQTRRGIGVVQSFRQIFDYWPYYLGLGGLLSIGFSIPILSSFFLPLAVIAGTILQSKIESNAGKKFPTPVANHRS